MRTLEQTANALAEGKTTSRALVEECLARIADPAGEGARAFIKTDADWARAMADAMDALRRAGRAPGRYAGIPVALKDLFDIAGQPTPAGFARAGRCAARRGARTCRAAHGWPPASCRWAAPT